jgi:hypothetical protein
MWAQQHYAIQTPKGRHSQNSDRILIQMARLLRSAGAHFYAWDRQIARDPDRALRDSQRRIMLMDGVGPSDKLGYTFMMTGMAKRMGDHSKPPIAHSHPPASALGDAASRYQVVGMRNLDGPA